MIILKEVQVGMLPKISQNISALTSFFTKVFFIMLVGFCCPAFAATGDLEKYLAEVPAHELFPAADGYGVVLDKAPIAPVLKAGEVVGYAFINTDFVGAIGYSGKPIIVLIGMDEDGLISGARLVKHSEPIVLAGIPEKKIADFIDGYKTIDILKLAREKGGEPPPVDIVSGATVTIMVIDDTIKRASVRAARVLGLGGLSTERQVAKAIKTLLPSEMQVLSWETLLGDGSIRRLLLTNAQVNASFIKQGNEKAIARPEKGADEDVFIDLYVASLAVPSIARSLLGKWEYPNYLKRIKEGEQAFIVMGKGRYSFRGSGYVRGGIFDRIQVVQGEEGFRFNDHGYKNLGEVSARGRPISGKSPCFIPPKGRSIIRQTAGNCNFWCNGPLVLWKRSLSLMT